MQVLIKFTKPLQHIEGRGWRSGDIGPVFPFEVTDFADQVDDSGVCTLALKPPTRLEFEDSVVVLRWESSEKTIGISIHANLIASLTLKRQ